MNRYKIRVWDKQKNEFFPVKNGMVLCIGNTDKFLAFATNQGLYPIPDTGQKDFGEDRWVLQQFTGLLDKNSKGIYEGDIVRIQTEDDPEDLQWEIIPIEFKNACFWVSGLFCQPIYELTIDGKFDGEIIGNIFENLIISPKGELSRIVKINNF